jgi:two-component system sensor histidine kinase DegS
MEALESLDRVVRKTLTAMENGQKAIFAIAESARSELQRLQQAGRRLQPSSGQPSSGHPVEAVAAVFSEAAAGYTPPGYAMKPTRHTRLERKKEGLAQTLKQANMLLTRLGVALQCLQGSVPDSVLEDWGLSGGRQCGQLYVQMLDNERCRIAREIHDGPAQALANLLLKTVFCEQVLTEECPGIRNELLGLKEIIRGSLQDIRKILFDLRPKELDQGLICGLRQLIEDYQERYGLSITFICSGQEKRLQRPVVGALFRIVQEALNNIWKHSCCDHALIRLELEEHRVRVHISDDGIGFDPQEVAQHDGRYGLIGMRDRARLLDGTLLINTAPGQGTRVVVTIPLVEEEDGLG